MAVSATIDLEQSGGMWIVSDGDDKEAHEKIMKIIWSDVCCAFEDDDQKTLWTDIFAAFGFTLNFTVP